MEAYITPPDPATPNDPLTRLLAAILAWLRALLAEHQAGLLPPTPTRRNSAGKTAEAPIAPSHAQRPTRGRLPAIALVCPRVARIRDMTIGLPRPRLVAPS